jgi:hypothetical protein
MPTQKTEHKQAHLQEDVGGVEVAVADAVGMHVAHAERNVCENLYHRCPPRLTLARRQCAATQHLSQTLPVAVLLHVHHA